MRQVAQPTDPLASAYAAYEQFESRLSTAMDQLVATNGFAELFTTSASTMMALTRMVNGAIDEAVRGTRLAARQDVTSLARQLARTEDKLERVLQLVEQISDRLDALEAASAPGPAESNGDRTAARRTASKQATKRTATKRTASGRVSGGPT